MNQVWGQAWKPRQQVKVCIIGTSWTQWCCHVAQAEIKGKRASVSSYRHLLREERWPTTKAFYSSDSRPDSCTTDQPGDQAAKPQLAGARQTRSPPRSLPLDGFTSRLGMYFMPSVFDPKSMNLHSLFYTEKRTGWCKNSEIKVYSCMHEQVVEVTFI